MFVFVQSYSSSLLFVYIHLAHTDLEDACSKKTAALQNVICVITGGGVT